MTHPVKGIDHCYLLVNDLEKAAQNFRNLGFTLSPRGLHSPHMGTANYTIMLQVDYFELLGVVDETPISKLQLAKLASQGDGLHAVVGRIDNAKHAHDNLIKLGFDVEDVQSFSRPVNMPDGGEAIAAFETVTIKPKYVPNGIFFLCDHKTKNVVWQPSLMQHENGAKALDNIYVIAESPHEAATSYSALFSNSTINKNGDIYSLVTGDKSARLTIFPAHLLNSLFGLIDLKDLPHGAFAGFSVLVDDLDRVKRILAQKNIPWHETPRQTIYIGPQYANGTILEFVV